MKKAKRILSIMLVMALVLGFMPSTKVNAASPKLNATKKTMYAGNYFQLTVKNYKKTVKWTSSNNKVASVTNGNVYAKAEGKATITAKCGKKKLTCKITVKLTDDQKLTVVRNWLVSNIWNEGFCDLGAYAESKTDSCGETMNVDYTLTKLSKNIVKIDEYTAFINSLDDENLKYQWSLIDNEIRTLYDKATSLDWHNFKSYDEWNSETDGEYVSMFDVSMFSTYLHDLLSILD